jgi:hypothetical protein
LYLFKLTRTIAKKIEIKTVDISEIFSKRKIESNFNLNFATETNILCEKTLKKIKISVVWGNILDENVDCIVNPANSNMLHVGGLAALIVKKGGQNNIIQRESEEYLKNSKLFSINTGDCIFTNGGDLIAKFVIHCVGPMVYIK